MSTVPTNPFWTAMENWLSNAQAYWAKWKAQGQTWRSVFWQRFQGPAPASAVRPLRYMRLSRMGMVPTTVQGRQVSRGPVARGRVIPHVINQPYKETYDYTYRSPNATPPFATNKRLGLEGEKYDFTF